jgi:hypothetical protein
MAQVTARRFRRASPATAVVLFMLTLALGVAALPAGAAGGGPQVQPARYDADQTVAAFAAA